jgi:hypothetical protein
VWTRTGQEARLVIGTLSFDPVSSCARTNAMPKPDDDRSSPKISRAARGAPVTRKDLQFVVTRIGLVKPKASMLFAICFFCAFWSRDAARRGRSFRRAERTAPRRPRQLIVPQRHIEEFLRQEGGSRTLKIVDGPCASMSQQRSAQTRVALAQFPTTALVKADFRRALSQPHSQSRPPSS